jgi:hypothetical protein
LAKATVAGQRIHLEVVVEESGSKPAYTKERNLAGDSRSFDSPSQNESGCVYS